jgi:hypothetical protein
VPELLHLKRHRLYIDENVDFNLLSLLPLLKKNVCFGRDLGLVQSVEKDNARSLDAAVICFPE